MNADIRHLIDLVEAKGKVLELNKLPYGRSALAPVMSQATIDYHYGKLARGYVDRFNKGEGDKTFNEAGAFLHNIFFPQLQLYVFIPASRFILATHGISASFVLIALGLVLPVHLKAGWLARSNRLSGVFQIVCLLTLIGSGFLLYYGPEPLRDLTLLAHYVFGFFFIGFFTSVRNFLSNRAPS